MPEIPFIHCISCGCTVPQMSFRISELYLALLLLFLFLLLSFRFGSFLPTQPTYDMIQAFRTRCCVTYPCPSGDNERTVAGELRKTRKWYASHHRNSSTLGFEPIVIQTGLYCLSDIRVNWWHWRQPSDAGSSSSGDTHH
ncbi:uncharacterized protein BDW43DRAFT_70656 [Aspergillus alliaceus]|uniref:uncharacterized protein n=1 Tax=Petromyces alliaceus TaxID=209559 RepID=UPI0012A4253B|nr:uncharacterized protein BDW43DRAFT_70656 [Aspergillus alliaceus]KAB8238880.1 hypothetical protein BDW43DRAFT_70656 [Aspergillus alliaceus]